MKLWRKSGYRKLSGRLYGSDRDTVYNKIPSPLIYALINRVAPALQAKEISKPLQELNLVGPAITVGS
jgi:hypothetical protein